MDGSAPAIAGAVYFGRNAPQRAGHLDRGAAEGIRTPDPRITNAVLYRLSYSGAGRDLEQNASDYAICGWTASHFADSHRVTASIITKPYSSTKRTPIRYANERLLQWVRPPCFIPRQKTEKYAKAVAMINFRRSD
jgi:hypothetical protein